MKKSFYAKEEWNKKFAMMDKVRERMTDEAQDALKNILDREIKAVRVEKKKA